MASKHVLLRSGSAHANERLGDTYRNGLQTSSEAEARSELSKPTSAAHLNGFVALAALDAVKGSNAEIAVIDVGENTVCSEWKKSDGSTVLIYANSTTGMIKGSSFSSSNQSKGIPTLGNPSDTFELDSIMAVYLYFAVNKYPNAKAKLDILAAPTSSDEERQTALICLSDYVEQALSQEIFKATIEYGNITALTIEEQKTLAGKGKVIWGTPKILAVSASAGSSSSPAKAMTLKKAKERYKTFAEKRTWTEEQVKRIPAFSDDYMVPVEAIEMADAYVAGIDTKLPANNLCWRGVTGCGKSTGVALMAAMLNMPLYIVTCYTNMETEDFLPKWVPDTTSQTEEAPALPEGMPEFMQIRVDPKGAYEQLTGLVVSDVSSQEVLEAYGRACAASAKAEGGTQYKLVYSEYIQGLQDGGIVEIQEASRIRNQGVLVGLNEYDHAGAVIHLADGSSVTRSSYALCVWTDNVGYESCRSLDPSVLRRMDCIFDTFDLEKSAVLKRLKFNTGGKIPTKMSEYLYNVWNDVREFCQREEIAEGELSPSDLEHWAVRVKRGGIGCVKSTVRPYLISRLTTDREAQDKIMECALISIDKYQYDPSEEEEEDEEEKTDSETATA